MINFNDPFFGQMLMYIFILMFGAVMFYGVFKLTRPFNDKLK